MLNSVRMINDTHHRHRTQVQKIPIVTVRSSTIGRQNGSFNNGSMITTKSEPNTNSMNKVNRLKQRRLSTKTSVIVPTTSQLQSSTGLSLSKAKLNFETTSNPKNKSIPFMESSKQIGKRTYYDHDWNFLSNRSFSRTQWSGRPLMFHTTSINEDEEKEEKRKRRRCGAFFYSPCCCFCCCLSILFILTAITAAILALLIRSPQKTTQTPDVDMTTGPVASYNGSCLTDNNCNGTLFLTCHNRTCVCSGSTSAGTWFWGGTSCLLCPIGWMNFDTHCYYLSNTTKNWNDSRAYCQNHGADLMVIGSLEEYNFITEVGRTLMPTTDWIQAWIGLITIIPFSPGLFRWLDGINITGLNPPNYIWCKSPYWYHEPDYQTRTSLNQTIYQMCGGLVHASNQSWPTEYICVDDNYCDDQQYFICEMSN